MGKPSDPLIESIDKAADELLKRVSAEGDVPLPERVKAFQAIVQWAETKMRLVPVSKGDSKFGQLRSRLNGGTSKRGAVHPEGEEGSSATESGG